MRPLRVTIIDLVTKGPTNTLYARMMNQNLGQHHAPSCGSLV